MKKHILLILSILGVFIFTGCSQKISISSYAPAKIDRASQTKNIHVERFLNDNIGITNKLETSLSQKIVYGKPYFTVLSRSQLNNILEEQKLQQSGLVSSKNVQPGKLIGSQAIISGEVVNSSVETSRFYQTRTRCVDKKCKETYKYRISCTNYSYLVSVNIKMTDVSKGDIIYSETLEETDSYGVCRDSSYSVPNRDKVFSTLTNYIVNDFVNKISPNKITRKIELLEDPEIDYSDKQETLLENSLILLKQGRLLKAEEKLSELLTSTNEKCYVVAYNLGVVKESLGKYRMAQQLYILADNLVPKPEKLISESLYRINTSMRNKKLVKTQVEK